MNRLSLTHNIFMYGAFSILSIVFLISPYQNGLFFEKDMYIWSIIINLIFIIIGTFLLFNKEQKQFIISFSIFSFPLLYLIAYFGAESPFSALQQTLRWTSYAAFFFTLYEISRNNLAKRLMSYIFYILIIWLSIFPFFVQWGLFEFPDAWLGERIAGAFQYPNTFSTIIAMGWLYGLVQLTKIHIKWYQVIFYSIPLVLFTAAILLSFSRGVLVLLPIAWFIGLILLNIASQLRYLALSVTSILGGIFIFRVFNLNENMPYTGFKELVIFSLIIVLITWTLSYLNKKEGMIFKNKFLRWSIPAFLFTVVIGLVIDLWKKGFIFSLIPQALQERISTISLTTNSVAARIEFYKQSIEMSKDAPLFGYGGDGWRVLFTKYQQIPFWSRETHNFYLESVLNIGWFGTILVLMIVLLLFYFAGKHIVSEKNSEDKITRLATIPGLTLLFLHLAIDFDFSYGTVVLIFVWLLVMLLPHNIQGSLQNHPKATKFIQIVVIISVGLATFITYQLYSAHTLIANANGQEMTYEKSEQLYLAAKDKNPWDTEYHLELAKIYVSANKKNNHNNIKERAQELLKKAEKLEPHNPSLHFEIGKLYGAMDEDEKAIKQFEKAIKYDQFSSKYTFAYIVQNVLYSERLLSEGNSHGVQKYLNQATDAYEEQLNYINVFKNKYVPNRRKLSLDNRAHVLVSEAYLLKGNVERALQIINKVNYNRNKQKQEFMRAQAIKYLLAKEKNQGKKQEKILDQVSDKEKLKQYVNFISSLKK